MTTMNNEDPADPSVHEQRVLDAAQEARLEDHAYAEGRKDEREATLAEFAGKPMCKPCAEAEVLACQVNSLRDALVKVLDTREKEANAWFAYETARDNFTGGAALERRRHLAMMQATGRAEKEARLLLATLKTPNADLSGRTRSA